MRCFVALDFPDDVRAATGRTLALLRQAAPSADVRWVNPAQMHVTVKFLGEVTTEQVAVVSEALRRVASREAPAALTVQGLGGFPAARRARAVWVGIADAGGWLPRLAAAVERVLAPLGFPLEGRAFRGHVTLGRVRSPRGLDRLAAALAAATDVRLGQWTPHAVTLYRSHLEPSGARYAALAVLPFS